MLSGIAATGDLVVSVELLDMENGQRAALPPEAFDGEPIAPHIRKLEADWKAQLNQPATLQAVYQFLTNQAGKVQRNCQARIDRLDLAISQTQTRIEQMQARFYQDDFTRPLEDQLAQYRRQLVQAQAGHRRFCQRLAPYLDDL